MNRVSILQQAYYNQKRSTIKESQEEKKQRPAYWRVFFIWTLIGVLTGSLALAPILVLYIKQQTATVTVTPVTSSLRWNSTGITVVGITSVSGNASNQLYNPFGLNLGLSNTLYIADRRNNRIQQCRIDTSSCMTVAGQANTTQGTTLSDLSGPTFVQLDSSDNLYVVDTANHRVQFWAKGATSGTTIAGTTGSLGSANNQFNLPYGIVYDSKSGTIYIADYNNHRIVSYLSGATSGTVIAGGQGAGTNSTQLYRPAGLYLDSLTNSLIIANFGAHNIVRWVIGANSGTVIVGSINGSAGNSSTFLKNPTDVTLDPMGNMYVADMFNHRIQLYLAGQSSGTTIAGITSQIGNNSSMLNYPQSVRLDNQLNLYVSDAFNQRIQKFLRY